MSTEIEVVNQNIESVRERFITVAEKENLVLFEKEKSYALQALMSNATLLKTAMDNQQSLQAAIFNVALAGLTLSPVQKLAYLIPRKSAVVLEPSYMGLIKILTDAGIVKSIRAEVVYRDDTFNYELGTAPFIKHVPLITAERKKENIIAVYAVAEFGDNQFQMEVMSKSEIDNIMNRSESAKSGSFSPWKTDYSEMARKTVLRRAYKYLPKSNREVAEKLEALNSNDFDDFELVETKSKAARVFDDYEETPKVALPLQAEIAQSVPEPEVQQAVIAEPPTGDGVADDLKEYARIKDWTDNIESCKNITDITRISALIAQLEPEDRKQLTPKLNAQMAVLGIERDLEKKTFIYKQKTITPKPPQTQQQPINSQRQAFAF